jgi:WD40 repeat protein
MASGGTTAGAYVLEKLFTIQGCDDWVTKMIHEPNFKRIYAISENSVSICDLRSQSVKIRLHEIHEAPVTCVCWYAVDQYYLTACSRGQVCCWSPRPTPSANSTNSAGGIGASSPAPPSKHTLLHSFFAHSKGVTGLALHPSPGMFITAGLDGYIKVWDFEIYSLLQCLSLSSGLTHFKVCQFNSSDVCLFALSSGEAGIWKINSCCSEFSLCASDVLSLHSFDSFIQSDHLLTLTEQENGEMFPGGGGGGGGGEEQQRYQQQQQQDRQGEEKNQEEGEGGERSRPPTALPPTLAALEAGIESADPLVANSDQDRRTPKPGSRKSKKPSNNNSSATSVLPSIPVIVSAPLNLSAAADPNAATPTDPLPPPPPPPPSAPPPTAINLERTILAFAGNDLQVMTPSGHLKSRVEPDALVEGVSAIAFSVFQQLLFCLLENSHIRIFCTKSTICVLLREVYVGAIGSDEPTALVITDTMTSTPSSSSTNSGGGGGGGGGGGSGHRTSSTSRDMRGNRSPLNCEEILMIGTCSGTLICLDTFQECQTVGIQQIFSGKVEDMKYRQLRKELIGVGYSLTSVAERVIKIWKVGGMSDGDRDRDRDRDRGMGMVLMHEISCDVTFSCWEISLTYSLICIGCSDGFTRLFHLIAAASAEGSFGLPPASAPASGTATAIGIGIGGSLNSRTNTPLLRPLTGSGPGPSSGSGDPITLENKNLPTSSRLEVPQGRHLEVIRQEGGHEDEILAISFCDELRAYATSAMDCTIKFWDFEKRIIKSILFNSPPRCILFTSSSSLSSPPSASVSGGAGARAGAGTGTGVGNILLTQGRHISLVLREVWEERGLLQIAKDSEDPWERISGLQEEEMMPISRGIYSSSSSSRRGKVRMLGGGGGEDGRGNEQEDVSFLQNQHQLYNSTTFLTEDERIQFDLSLLSYGILPDTILGGGEGGEGGGGIAEYWKHHSSLTENLTISQIQRRRQGKEGKKLNVRHPKYKVNVPEGKKRFAARAREKRAVLEQERYEDQHEEVEYDGGYEGMGMGIEREKVMEREGGGGRGEENDEEERGEGTGVRMGRERNMTILKEMEGKQSQRKAFIRTTRVVLAATALSQNVRQTSVMTRKPTNISLAAGGQMSRLTGQSMLKPTPPTSSMSSAVNSLLQRQLSLGVAGGGCAGAGIRLQSEYYNEEYHIKPNGSQGSGGGEYSREMFNGYGGGRDVVGSTLKSSRTRKDFQRNTQML